jgi:hypothetical protein
MEIKNKTKIVNRRFDDDGDRYYGGVGGVLLVSLDTRLSEQRDNINILTSCWPNILIMLRRAAASVDRPLGVVQNIAV